MKILNCPLNGPRNIDEFLYGGELRDAPDPVHCSDEDWAKYVFFRTNQIEVNREWWYHIPSAYWFIVERHTATDEVLRTYDTAELFLSSES